MRFNTVKGNIISFGPSGSFSPNYYLGGKTLKVVDTVKYLGVQLCSNLKWDTHIHYALGKANKIFGLMKATLLHADPKVKKVAYFTLCRPILEYGSEAWDPVNKTLITQLETFQNRVTRFIFNIKGRDVSMTNIKKENHIQLLEHRRRDARFSIL
jgi:hypothetical protein